MTFSEIGKEEDLPVPLSSEARLVTSCKKAGNKISRSWGQWTLYQDEGRLIAHFPSKACLVIDPQRGHAEGFLVDPMSMHPDFRVSFFYMALRELLRFKGFLSLHAIALEKDGLGVLIPGASGRGKTTTCLALLRAGYRCLSDDHPLVHENGNGLEVLSFPEKIDVTDNTIKLFPELQNAGAFLHQGMRKRFFHVEDLYPGGTGDTCVPAILLFPHVVDSPTSRLESLSKRRALETLLPEGLLVSDQEVAKREFQTYSRLVEQTDCYHLHFGRDVLDLPQLINPLLERVYVNGKKFTLGEA